MARAAKEGLDGADIYSGCCTLKIEYAKVSFRLQRATTYLDGSLGRHSSLERHRYSFLGRMPEIIFFSLLSAGHLVLKMLTFLPMMHEDRAGKDHDRRATRSRVYS